MIFVMDNFWLGVAVGSGWQSYVAYINLGCYYGIGVPLGFLMGWGFKFGVMVITIFLHMILIYKLFDYLCRFGLLYRTMFYDFNYL